MHLHRWNKWGPKFVTHGSYATTTELREEVQERMCEKCGLVDRRIVGNMQDPKQNEDGSYG